MEGLDQTFLLFCIRVIGSFDDEVLDGADLSWGLSKGEHVGSGGRFFWMLEGVDTF